VEPPPNSRISRRAAVRPRRCGRNAQLLANIAAAATVGRSPRATGWGRRMGGVGDGDGERSLRERRRRDGGAGERGASGGSGTGAQGNGERGRFGGGGTESARG
jgi:hypothetical protein